MIRALLIDAGGTLLHPAEPVPRLYTRVARGHGVDVSEDAVAAGFRRAFRQPWPGRRYEGDGSPFWRAVVAEATGSDDPALFDALYDWYTRPEAWTVDAAAVTCLGAARAAGIRTGLASNWDTRLRPLLQALDLVALFDTLAISAEVGVEKPDPALLRAALDDLGVRPTEAVHVGDDEADVLAARGCGCRVWRPGIEVTGFEDVQARIIAEAPTAST